MYTLYILQCSNNALYAGIAKDLEKRLAVHRSGKGSKYVRANSPFKLVYTEIFEDKSSALKREIMVKKLKRVEKMRLIEENKE